MEDAILKYGRELGFFALLVYFIWSDRQDRAADRIFWSELIKWLKENK